MMLPSVAFSICGSASREARTQASRSTSMLASQLASSVAHAVAGGVVDQHVDAAERLGRGGDVALDDRLLREIAGGGVRLAGMRSHFLARCLQCLGAARADRDVSAALREPQRDGAADATAAAAHHHAPVPDVDVHYSPLVSRNCRTALRNMSSWSWCTQCPAPSTATHARGAEVPDAAVLLRVRGPAFRAVDQQRRAGDARHSCSHFGSPSCRGGRNART